MCMITAQCVPRHTVACRRTRRGMMVAILPLKVASSTVQTACSCHPCVRFSADERRVVTAATQAQRQNVHLQVQV